MNFEIVGNFLATNWGRALAIAGVFAVATKPLPADAGRIFDMLFQVLKYNVLRDGAVGG